MPCKLADKINLDLKCSCSAMQEHQLCLKMWRLLLLLLGIGVLSPGCQAECNVCSATSNAACVSDTQFMFCQNNLPALPINSCPTGYYCTANSAICQTNFGLRSCDDCGVCSSTGTFACVGVRTFALCMGSDTPMNITGSCAPNYFCNKDDPNICTSVALGSQPTCPLVDDELSTTVTPPTYIDPNTYCRNLTVAGRYPYGNDLNTTCRQYIRCYVNAGIWYGALYNCPGLTYFHSTTMLCNSTIPATCSSRVQNLQVLNLRLF